MLYFLVLEPLVLSPLKEKTLILQRRGTIATMCFLQHPGRDSQGPRLCLVISTFLAVTTTTATYLFFFVTVASICVPPASATAQEVPCARKGRVGEVLRCCPGQSSSALLEVHRCAKCARMLFFAFNVSFCVGGVFTK